MQRCKPDFNSTPCMHHCQSRMVTSRNMWCVHVIRCIMCLRRVLHCPALHRPTGRGTTTCNTRRLHLRLSLVGRVRKRERHLLRFAEGPKSATCGCSFEHESVDSHAKLPAECKYVTDSYSSDQYQTRTDTHRPTVIVPKFALNLPVKLIRPYSTARSTSRCGHICEQDKPPRVS